MRTLRVSIIFLAIVLHFETLCQNRLIDSLVRELKTAKSDTGKVKLLNALSSQYILSANCSGAVKNGREALELARKLDYKAGIVKAYGNIGIAERISGHYTEAVQNFLETLKIYEDLNDRRGIALAYNNMGVVYYSQGNYSEALKSHQYALKIREELKLTQEIAGSYNNIGLVYYQQMKFDEALENFTRSLKMVADNNKRLKATLFTNIANILQEQDKLGEALLYYTYAYDLKDPADPVAQQHFNEQKAHILLKQKKYAEAKKIMLLSLEQAIKLQEKEHISFAYDNLTKLSKELKDYKSALEYRELWDRYKDTLLNQENSARAMALKNQFDLDKQNVADSLRLEAQKRFDAMQHEQAMQKQRLLTWGGLMAFVFMLLVTIILVRANLQRRRANEIISKQKHLVEEKQKEVMDSIQYARRIQSTLLPNEKFMQRNLERMKPAKDE